MKDWKGSIREALKKLEMLTEEELRQAIQDIKGQNGEVVDEAALLEKRDEWIQKLNEMLDWDEDDFWRKVAPYTEYLGMTNFQMAMAMMAENQPLKPLSEFGENPEPFMTEWGALYRNEDGRWDTYWNSWGREATVLIVTEGGMYYAAGWLLRSGIWGIRSFRLKMASRMEATYYPGNPGPLPVKLADTFNGATYTRRVLTEDAVMYRVSGGTAGKTRPFLTRIPQNGGVQSQLDLALNPSWGNTAERILDVRLSRGIIIYEGTAAPQNLYSSTGHVIGRLPGGVNQVFIPRDSLHKAYSHPERLGRVLSVAGTAGIVLMISPVFGETPGLEEVIHARESYNFVKALTIMEILEGGLPDMTKGITLAGVGLERLRDLKANSKEIEAKEWLIFLDPVLPTVSGRIVDESKTPIQGAQVVIYKVKEGRNSQKGQKSEPVYEEYRRYTTDITGKFQFELPMDKYKIEYYKYQVDSDFKEFELVQGDEKDLGDLVLKGDMTGRIHFTVFEQRYLYGPIKIGSAAIVARRLAEDGNYYYAGKAWTDSSGAATLTLSDGKYMFEISASGYEAERLRNVNVAAGLGGLSQEVALKRLNKSPSPTPRTTPSPKVTVSPKATPSPKVTVSPKATPSPQATVSPKATPSPQATVSPKATPSPQATKVPEATPGQQVTQTPTVTPTPEVTPGSKVTPTVTYTPQVTPAAPPSPGMTVMPTVEAATGPV